LYNFLVTAQENAWDSPAYEYDRGRFGEYTSPGLRERFATLTAQNIGELKSYPALFAYEGEERDVRVGYLRRIKERVGSVFIEYEFEPEISAIPFYKIAPLKSRFDIGNWEMNRTHWALKDENLFEVLHSAGLVDENFSPLLTDLALVEEVRFKVALSFPGEKRDYVKEVAKELKKRLPKASVFYDGDFTAQLARPNLDTLLQKIYGNNSDLVVVFLCSEYEKKQWCGLEWRAIREIIKGKGDHSLMLLRFDDAVVPGSFSLDGYIDLNKYSPLQTAGFILERVRLADVHKG
jgi:hypothetical protein